MGKDNERSCVGNERRYPNSNQDEEKRVEAGLGLDGL